MSEDTPRHQQFIDEAKDMLDSLEQNLLILEEAETVDLVLVNDVFRSIHTIKGGADFLGLKKIKELSHAAEDVLDQVRKESLVLTEQGVSTLLVVIDCLKEMVGDPDNAEKIDITELMAEVKALSGDENNTVKEYSDNDGEAVALGANDLPNLFCIKRREYDAYKQDGFSFYILTLDDCGSANKAEVEVILASLIAVGYVVDSKCGLDSSVFESINESGKDCNDKVYILFRSVLTRTTALRYLKLDPKCLYEIKDSGPSVGSNTNEEESKQDVAIEEDRRAERRADRRRSINDRRDRGTGNRRGREQSETELLPGFEKSTQEVHAYPELDQQLTTGEKKSQAIQSVRVNVEILDSLMNLVGELVLTRNQLSQNVEQGDQSQINITAQRLDIVTSELQESIMATRMQPLGNILGKFHRIIRDMSNHLGKSVNLVLEGEDVELDKSIIEAISDPLTHLVRNAVDHGIENPEKRHRIGKPVNATLAIKARQEAGHVVIEISDDGRGIDKAKVKQRAIENGLVDELKAENISEKELMKLIFSPGFSTADVVSDISGRGVGLDVVFTNISKMGGAIDVDTEFGVGTTFKVSLPLTLAIVPSLLVSSKRDTFAIPQINLVELVRIPADQVTERIKFLGDAAVMRLRDSLLPIVWLDNIVGKSGENDWVGKTTNVAVVFSGEFYYGIVVDQFTDSEEIVVKPLGKHLKNCRAYASATILGDGSAALILDVNGIAESVSIPSQSDLESAEEDDLHEEVIRKAEEALGNESSLLVVEDAAGDYFGIELAYVNRIERIRRSSVEHKLDKYVVKYRGSVLRVFLLNKAADEQVKHDEDEQIYLIVFYLMGQEVAVMVSNIVDIVESETDIEKTAIHENGIVGTSIIMDKITFIVDLFGLVESFDPSLIANSKEILPQRDVDDKKQSVLVVEDSVFFQDKLKSLLEDMDINVTIAGDGKIGFDELCQHDGEFDLVLMDIEMPNMDGLELSRLLRSDSRFKNIPIIMLTSLAKQTDIDEGIKAGANDYLIKMDQEMVKKTVYKHLNNKVTAVER